jgi:hypothetical protein
MLGNDVLKSFIVNSRTKAALLGYGYEFVAASHRGSVRAPDSA